MPKTLRAVTTASSTISRPPSGSTIPVSSSVSAPVIAIDSAFTASSVSDISSVPLSAVQPESITAEPLLSRQGNPIAICLESFNFSVELGRSVRILRVVLLPSLSSNYSGCGCRSSRPIYNSCPLFLPSRVRVILHVSDLGSTRPSTISSQLSGPRGSRPASNGVMLSPSQETRLHSSRMRVVALCTKSDNGDRSRASLSRGNFEDRDASLVSGVQSLADYYVDDNLDYDYARPFPV